jgi:hypothetical protein
MVEVATVVVQLAISVLQLKIKKYYYKVVLILNILKLFGRQVYLSLVIYQIYQQKMVVL